MKYTPYSPYKIEIFKQCKAKFKFQYIDKVDYEFVDSENLLKGKIIHKIFEHYDKNFKEILDILKNDKEFISSEFFSNNLIRECFRIFKNFKDNKFGKKIFKLKNLGNEVSCAIDYNLNPVQYFDNNILFRGRIDSIFVDEKKDEVYIIDWKTGKDRSSGKFKQSFLQLISYANWYFSKFPVDTLIIMYYFIEHNRNINMKLYRKDLDKYNKILTKNIENIENCKSFDKNISPLCDYCHFKEYCRGTE